MIFKISSPRAGSVLAAFSSAKANSTIIKSIFSTSTGISKSSDAVQLTLSGNYFNTKLEKHLDDVKHGEGDLSRDVGAALSNLSTQNSSNLAQTNPKALTSYLGYQTGLGYGKNARYVTGVGNAIQTEQLVNQAVEDGKNSPLNDLAKQLQDAAQTQADQKKQ